MTLDDLFDAHVATYRSSIERSSRIVGKNLDFFANAKVHHIRHAVTNLGIDLASSSLIDVGCGPGVVDRFLEPNVGELVGVDVSRRMIDQARVANPGVRYEHSDGQRIPFGTGSFDVAIACCVLHHVPPGLWDAFLAEMVRVVRPGGAVVVVEHNPRNPMTLHMVRTCPFDRDAVLARPARVRAGLAGADVGRIVTDYVMFLPIGSERTRLVERRLRRIPIGAQYVVAARRAEPVRPLRTRHPAGRDRQVKTWGNLGDIA